MAKVTSFKDRITDLVGSLGTADDDAIEQWVLDGCYDVMTKVVNIDNPMTFSIQSSSYSSAMAVDITELRDIVLVERNNIACKPTDVQKRHLYDNVDSLYFLTDDDPGFYILNNQLIVKPNPTASQQAHYTYIPEYSITDFTGTSSIDNYPKKYYAHIILYAAIMTAARRMQDLMDDTAVNTMYSLDNIRNLINGDIPTADTDLLGLLADEDIDMIQATVGVSTEASKLIAQKYTWLQQKIDLLLNQYLGKFPQAQGEK